MISSTKQGVKSSIEVKLMTVKRKKKSTFMGGKSVTVAFSLCLLAVVAMIGMYTVGKSDQKQKELEQQVAEAEQKQAEEKEKQEEARKAQEQELEREQEQRQEAASASAQRQKETEEKEEGKETHAAYGAELESDFQVEQAEIAENIVIDEIEEASIMDADAVIDEPTLSFSPDMDKLMWPIAGNVILDYSMDKSVYFSTLNQYKYNPAVIIQGSQDASVMCAAQGKVTSIDTLDETGTTVTMDIGDGYELIYGQLKELMVKEGDYLKAGETIGYVSEPTKYYAQEGCNVYFEVRKDGVSVDPMPLLQ